MVKKFLIRGKGNKTAPTLKHSPASGARLRLWSEVPSRQSKKGNSAFQDSHLSKLKQMKSSWGGWLYWAPQLQDFLL